MVSSSLALHPPEYILNLNVRQKKKCKVWYFWPCLWVKFHLFIAVIEIKTGNFGCKLVLVILDSHSPDLFKVVGSRLRLLIQQPQVCATFCFHDLELQSQVVNMANLSRAILAPSMNNLRAFFFFGAQICFPNIFLSLQRLKFSNIFRGHY